MTLVDNRQEVVGEIVEQAERAHTGAASGEIAAVVLDTRAVADFANHLDVVGDALGQSLGLKLFAFLSEKAGLIAEVEFDLA